jgi:hypothetical protein
MKFLESLLVLIAIRAGTPDFHSPCIAPNCALLRFSEAGIELGTGLASAELDCLVGSRGGKRLIPVPPASAPVSWTLQPSSACKDDWRLPTPGPFARPFRQDPERRNRENLLDLQSLPDLRAGCPILSRRAHSAWVDHERRRLFSTEAKSGRSILCYRPVLASCRETICTPTRSKRHPICTPKRKTRNSYRI